ncbi:uncharacterized protein Eint_090520 [Encephalitozoon intestinalis ATCC 50506]|uniref:5'-3' DNA helicase ZGRF1-like N-terminal domain-containing protein n=1 Tax=Encephalitozoon intestinalis (strain ATCC 50506) TaxID=876142 RepID=E0S9B7_ENCIT|nr:uncharacterized protein Eint_090520 [Encephalitozoon intestinalis ATCC 50506]ADM12181.1 hypothetical protein Eint_090520 [Encephalitozoon intestinalis ATCC 50506]UTX45985.1 hypothetical protein GPK93_09g15710 [Encephalitozoon intestinalis]
MIRCVYTMQKHKKLKTWMDGFIEQKGKRIHLYNTDMVKIDSLVASCLDNEMETPKYLLYIESFEDPEENEIKHQENPPSTSRTLKDRPEKDIEGNVKCSSPQGRSEEEIINLFQG